MMMILLYISENYKISCQGRNYDKIEESIVVSGERSKGYRNQIVSAENEIDLKVSK